MKTESSTPTATATPTVSTPAAKHVEKKITKANNALSRMSLMYHRLKKIEIRNLFQSMSKVINAYKAEHGKLIIDVQHVDKVSELKATNFVSSEKQEYTEKQVGKKLLVSIRSAKNNLLLGILNYTLPPRVYSRLQKEEAIIKRKQDKILAKKDGYVKQLERINSGEVKEKTRKVEAKAEKNEKGPDEVTTYKKSISKMFNALKKTGEGKKLLKSLKSDPTGKNFLSKLRNPSTFAKGQKQKGDSQMALAAA